MIFRSDHLKDRRFLVVGATGGAGRATSLLLAQCGASVILLGRDPEKTEKVRRELPRNGHSCHYAALIPDVDLCAQWFREHQGLDGIFHAAGAELIAPAQTTNRNTVANVFGSSLYPALGLLAAVGGRQSAVVKDGGSIVMMSSVAAERGTSGMAVYAASKAGIEGLVRSAAVEWATRRIRVNAIRAGAFSSGMHERITSKLTPAAMDFYAQKHPLGFGKAEDVANMAVYLLSDAARWITGAIIPVDGGISA